MDCKYCGSQLPEDETVCALCGKDNAQPEEIAENVQPEPALETELPAEQTEPALDEEMPSDDPEAELTEEQPAQKKKRSAWQVILTVGVCAVLLIAMAIVVISGTEKTEEGKRPVNTISDILSVFRENNIQCRSTFSVSESKAAKKADDVVATIGDHTLTNGQLQVFYWMHVSNFLSNYGTSYFDYTQPLNEQYYSEEDDLSWEQYFIEIAIEGWQRYTLLNIRAAEEQTQLHDYTDLAESIEEEAVANGYADTDTMAKTLYGNACTAQDYINYVKLYDIALTYFEEKFDAYEPTDEQIDAFYEENKAAFEASGLAKEDKTLVDVRHILIRLEDTETDAYGQVDYTEEQWEQCRQLAQAILDKYMEDPTQDNFGALAQEHSEDGSASVGGLYTDVAEGEMVEEFNDWIFDETRKAGDTGLVKTVYGYHVMYFVDREVTDGDWYEIAKTQLSSEYVTDLIEQAGETHPMDVNYKKIAIEDRVLQ